MIKTFSRIGRAVSVLAIGLMVFGGFPITAMAASTFTSITVGSQVGSLTSGTASSTTYLVTVNRTGSGNLDIALSIAAALPSGVSASFSPSTVSFTGNSPTSKTSTLTLTTTAGAAAGVSNFNVKGQDTSPGGSTKTAATSTLTIGAAPVPTTGTLTVTNVVVGGTKVVSDFPLFVDGQPVTSGVATTTAPGAHVVSQTNQANYTPVFSGSCDASGNVTITAGGSASCTVTNTYVAPTYTYVTTQAAGGISSSDATLNALNGDLDAIGHSFWVSTSTFSTSSPSIPAGVYSTPDFGAIAAGQTFSAPLSLVTTAGVPSNMPAITPNTTYYFAAWSNVGGTWHAGDILNFSTLTAPDLTAPSLPVHLSPANGTITTTVAQTSIDWSDSVDAEGSNPVTYVYEVSTSPATNPDGSFVSGTQYPVTDSSIATPGTPDGTYYWHVKAIDSVGNATAWTSPWSLTVDNSSHTGTIQITKYLCPNGTTVVRSANGVGGTVPAGCVGEAGIHFGYVHGDQTDANAPYPELTTPFTAGGVTDGSGVLSMSGLPSTGRYLVAETDSDNQQLPASQVLGLYCIGDGDTSNNNDNQELTFVPNDGTVQCVAYDEAAPLPATLTVIKNVVNGPIGTAVSGDFTMNVDGTNVSTSTFQGSSAGTVVTLDPGSYSVSESGGPANYSSDLSSDCSGTIAAGENKTCTITNTYSGPTTATIVIHKTTIPAGANQDFSYSLTQTDGETTTVVATTSANASVGSGTITDVAPGSYKLVEDDAQYWAFNDASCTVNSGDDSEPAGTPSSADHGVILNSVVAGATYDCTFTNIANGSGIRIIKKVVASDGVTPVPGDDTSFNLHITGYGTDAISQGNDVAHDSIAGTYTVTEDAKAGYDTLSFSPDENTEIDGGQFTVTNGATTTITVTNKQSEGSTGKIIVHKIANPSDVAQDFQFTLTHGANTFATTTASSTASGEIDNIPAGNYNLTESQIEGWNYGGVSCVYDGESIGSVVSFGENISIEAGDTVDCTFTNTSDFGSLRLVKNVVDNDGNDIVDTTPFTITLNNGATTTIAEGSDGLFTGLTPGEYTLEEQHEFNYDFSTMTPATINVTAGTTTVVTITNKKHANLPGFTGGGGPTGTGAPSTGGNGGAVLGASTDTGNGTTTASSTPGTTIVTDDFGTSCQSNLLIKDYLKIGAKNDPVEVKKLQTFLNTQNLGIALPVTGFFGSQTKKAVMLFQAKYANDILGPWVNAGRMAGLIPTGYVYKTTLRWINHLICLSAAIPPVQL